MRDKLGRFIKGIKIHAHHIKPLTTFPELQFVINNGITLCIKCHMKEEKHQLHGGVNDK